MSALTIQNATGRRGGFGNPGESTTASNVGTGAGVFSTKVGTDLRFKTLLAGAGITVTPGASDITIVCTVVPGEANTGANVGTGAGLVFRDKVGVTLNLKSIKAGAGVTVTNNADDITLACSLIGESTTVANAGTGAGLVYRGMTGYQIDLKSIKAGANITVTNNADDVTIAAAGGGPGAGTVGYFPYWATAASLSGTSLIFQDVANSRVGLNTIAPDSLFHIRIGASGKPALGDAIIESAGNASLHLRTPAGFISTIQFGNTGDFRVRYDGGVSRAELETNVNLLILSHAIGYIQSWGAMTVYGNSAGTYPGTILIDNSGITLAKAGTSPGKVILDIYGRLTGGVAPSVDGWMLYGIYADGTKLLDLNGILYLDALTKIKCLKRMEADAIDIINTSASRLFVSNSCAVKWGNTDAAPYGYISSTAAGLYARTAQVWESATDTRLSTDLVWRHNNNVTALVSMYGSGLLVLNADSLQLPLAKYVYWGDEATNGSFRLGKMSTELTIEKRVSGTWGSDVYTEQAVASGSMYNLTASYALIDFGTTDPSIVIAKPGTYLILVHILIESAVTVSVGGNVEIKVRRTNNTAADIAENVYYYDDADYVGYQSYGIQLRRIIYTTTNSNDILQVWGRFTGTRTAGYFEVQACSITAVRLR